MFNPDQMLVTLLQATVAAGASDLHLSVGRPPTARRDGVLVPFEGVNILTPHDTERIVQRRVNRRRADERAEEWHRLRQFHAALQIFSGGFAQS